VNTKFANEPVACAPRLSSQLRGELSVLPSSSFVEFEAQKLASPNIVWMLDGENAEELLREAAFANPLVDDNPSAFECTKKTFFADRYGGQGLGKNGGGARCGAIGRFQIKGIGQNALASFQTSYFHAYGGATLFEIALEAIWGNVCNIALPYGGARTIALIETGTFAPVKFPKSNGPKVTARAIAVREGPLRPAHFMRALYFRGDRLGKSGVLDGERTRQAMTVLPETLRQILRDTTDCCSELPQHGTINELLSGVFRRHAEQLACARAKRIMHGSLTASNVKLDGGWLDFGSISTVSDYGPIHIPRGAPHFMQEEELIRETVKDLSFYVGKYPVGGIASALSIADTVWDEFTVHFSKQLRIEFLVQLGLPRTFVTKYEDCKECLSLYCLIEKVVRRNQCAPFTILSSDDEYVPTMPKSFGIYSLNALVSAAASCEDPKVAFQLTRTIIPDERLAEEFTASYFETLKLFVSSYPEKDCRHFSTVVKLNGIRLNSACAQLYRTNLYPRLEGMIEDGAPLADYIDSLSDTAKIHLADCDIGQPIHAHGRCLSFEQGFVDLEERSWLGPLDSNSFRDWISAR
jgi:hypothetical protein